MRHFSSFLLASLLAVAGCGGAEPAPFGSVAVALTSTGADGAIYRLRPGTRVRMAQDGGGFFGEFDVGGDAAVVRLDLPVGEYRAQLFDGLFYPEGMWFLERVVGTTTETVEARLVTPMPVALEVLEDATTSLVFQFSVARGGVLTFAYGSVDVSIDVAVVEATGFRYSMGASPATVERVVIAPNAPAGLSTLVPGVGSANPFTITGTLGNWRAASPGQVCAALVVEGIGGDAILQDLLLEAVNASGAMGEEARSTACLSPGADGALELTVSLYRRGPPVTQGFADLGEDELGFFVQWTSKGVPEEAWDGRSLDLDALAGLYSHQQTSVRYEILADIPWYIADASVSGGAWRIQPIQ
jgi:hypothetical protein